MDSMDLEKLIASLSPAERNILPRLEDGIAVSRLAEKAGVAQVEAMRACQFLSNKGALTIEAEERETFVRTERGDAVLADGLPEERFLQALDTPKTLAAIQDAAGLEKQEVNAAIGILRRMGAIEMGEEISRVKDVDFSAQKRLLQTLDEVPQDLVKRGLVEKREKTIHTITLTDIGRRLQGADLSKEYAERLTSDMLKDGSWKTVDFRRYDVESPVPQGRFGRKHFVTEAIDAIKRLWIEMGFSEMTGTMTQSAFWDLDALFVPQDHPAREMQDTFYLSHAGKLPEWWEKIKRVHEDGGSTGSAGWRYAFSEEETKRVLLRTHTTALSARMLAQLDPEKDLPGKFFSVHKVFRNETLDWKHLFEFHQVEGIVVGEDLSLADLIGLQKEFYRKMGFTKIRFRPAYFPYTEPSAEVEVFHPQREEWVELGGMGVFRPEVVIPLLGKDVPVLAWGLGMERIITDYYSIGDLREIYSNDLSQLRAVRRYVPADARDDGDRGSDGEGDS